MDQLTQTVAVRAFSSDEELNEAMQKKLESIYVKLLSSAPVASSFGAHEAARENVQKLKSAQAWLSKRSRELFARTSEVWREIESALIESQATRPAALTILGGLEAEQKAVSRANSRIEAALLTSEIDRMYALWGLREVRGLELDGAAATPESLAAAGPEELFREAVEIVKAECGLTESERKN
jgi:hypothetical protein